MNKFSNILKLPPFSNHSLELLKNIYNKAKTLEPKRNLIESYNDYKKDIRVVLENIAPGDYPLKAINEITNTDTYVNMTLNVVDFKPSNLDEFAKLYNTKTHERYFS